jgi:hypothetical protein
MTYAVIYNYRNQLLPSFFKNTTPYTARLRLLSIVPKKQNPTELLKI